MHRIVVISAGPGGKEYITNQARSMARTCEVLIGSVEQLEAAGTSEGQTVHDEWGIENIMKRLEQYEGKKVGILVTGDAGIYSLSQRIMDRYGRSSVVDVVPGVSSLQVAFARIRESWLNVTAFSFREEPFEGFENILQCEKAALFCDREHDSRKVLYALNEAGLFQQQRRIYVCQELTLANESIVRIASPDDIETLAVKRREIVIIINRG